MNKVTHRKMTLNFLGHSLKAKLTAVIVFTVLISVTFGAIILVMTDIRDYQKDLSSQMILMAKTVGSYSATDIAFADKNSAEETLEKLDDLPNIINAHLYDKNGKWFTSYRPSKVPPELVSIKEISLFNFHDKTLTINVAIDFRVQHWGFIQLIVSTEDLNKKIANRLGSVFLLGFLLVVFAYVVASKLQNIISKPVLLLSETAKNIASTTDYSLRVETQNRDEIAILYDSFNRMLEKIEQKEKERDFALRALSESEARFTAMFNAIPDAVMFADTDRKIVLNNPAVFKMFQYTNEELCGQTTKLLYADKEEFINQGKIRFNPKPQVDTLPYEVQYIRKNGEIFWTETLGAKVTRENGEHIGFIGIFRDITERKQNEQELNRYRNELENLVAEKTRELAATNKELESFSYSVSHDLRAPLRSIDGFSVALLEDCSEQLDAAAKDYLVRIRHNTQRMDRLINDLLQLSRVTKKELVATELDLTAMAQRICTQLKEENPERKVTLKIEEGLTTNADEGLLYSLLENLLSNAWKYTSKIAEAEIQFGQLKNDNNPVFFVKDNGAGFDMQFVDKLFIPFQRLHSYSEFEGTGIGLATVQRIINRHGGRVWADSRIGEGANFFFSLPVR